MLSALFAAALWINLATVLNVPVSTTHSIVGGVLGAGVAAAGPGLVNWTTMANIAASWVISPVVGALIAASFLYFIKARVLNVENRLEAANKWVPLLIATMAAAFAAYMGDEGAQKGLEALGRRNRPVFRRRVPGRIPIVRAPISPSASNVWKTARRTFTACSTFP